jgi:hypothetical protein
VESLIHLSRGQKVTLDSDMAGLYGVPTKRLNEAVERNPDRFSPLMERRTRPQLQEED